VRFTEVPAKMEEPRTRTRGCNLRIDWNSAVEDNGSPISSYRVELQGGDGLFYQIDGCGSDESRAYCMVTMRTFLELPYILEIGAPILVRVSAENSSGFGEVSETNSSG
jgi:hypothetical protein